MTMKMFKPKSITDDALYDSTIAEPDVSLGEVEWSDPTDLGSYSNLITYTDFTLANTSEILTNGSKIYTLDGNGDLIVYDTDAETYTSTNVGVDTNGSSQGCKIGTKLYFTPYSNTDLVVVDTTTDASTIFDCTETEFVTRFVSAFPFNGELYLCDRSANIFSFDGSDFTFLYDSQAGTVVSACQAPSGNILVVGSYSIYVYNPDSDTVATLYSGTSTSNEYGTVYDCLTYSGTAYIFTHRYILAVDASDNLTTLYSFASNSNYLVNRYMGGRARFVNNKMVFAAYNSGTGVSTDEYSGVFAYDVDSNEVDLIYTFTQPVSDFRFNAAVMLDDMRVFAVGYEGSSTDGTYVFNARAPYTLNEQAIIASTHRKYQCVDTYVYESPEDGATGEDGATWVDIGATNRWASLDYEINSTSDGSGLGYLSWSFDIAEMGLFDEIAFFGLENCDRVRVVIYESDGTTQTYSKSYPLDLDPVDDADDLYNDTMYNDTYVITGLIAAGLESDSIIEVYVSAADDYFDDFGAGSICFGTSRTLGTVGDSSTVGLDDYSTYEYDDYGNLTTTVIPPADKGTYNLLIENQGYRYTRAILKNAIGETCVWYSYDNAGNTIPILGRYTTSTMTIVSPNTKTMPLKIKGVI